MKPIAFPDLIDAAQGIDHADIQDGLLYFRRFDNATLAYYERLNTARRQRALCTAGVTLAFDTDSDRLGVSIVITGKVRNYGFIDIRVSGVLAASAGSDQGPEQIDVDIPLPGAPGTHRAVTLHLPHCACAAIRTVSLTDGATIEPLPAPPLLLALGDSITQGMDAFHPSMTYAEIMARELRMSIRNLGVGGHVFDVDGLCAPPTPKPALITVAYGINDWNQGLEPNRAEAYLRQIRAWYPTPPIAVFEPIWAGAEGFDRHPNTSVRGISLDAYRQALRAIVTDFKGVRYISMESLLPPLDRFLSDGIHPSDIGHCVFGLNAAKILMHAHEARDD